MYSKPTDTHQYLDFKSCHPGHVKKGIPYGQALRLRRICDSDEVFEERLNEMKGHFIKRGFKQRFVESQFTKAKRKNRESHLCQDRVVNRSKVNRMPLVMNFHPALSGVGNIIDSIWPILHASDDMKEIFGNKPIISYRRPKMF